MTLRLALFLAAILPAQAQWSLGRLDGAAAAGSAIEIDGPPGLVLRLTAGAQGRFSASLPYGPYTVRTGAGAICQVRIHPLAVARCDLRTGQSTPTGDVAPQSPVLNAAQYLLFEVPAAFTWPLDFAALGMIRLPVVSIAAAPWTETRFRLHGLDATDSYQPGLPVTLDDAASEDSVVVREAAILDTYDVDLFLKTAGNAWHGGLTTIDTGSALAASNLPPPPDRGSVQRSEEFLWFTRDTAELSGPIGRWADFFAAATGQWAYQTAPQRPTATPIGSRLLFANPRGQIRLSGRDRLDALYSGSRLDLTNGGWPAGIAAILANRAMPSFYGVDGFQNLREVDHFDLVQAGWMHAFGAAALEVRYGYSTAHMDTSPINGQNTPAMIGFFDPAPVDAPFSNFAVRTRHQAAAVWHSGEARLGGSHHSIWATGAFESSQPRNRFQATAGTDILTVAGQPVLLVQLNTPTETRSRINAVNAAVGDAIEWTHGLSFDLGVVLDSSHGSASGAPGGISWTNAAPRTAILFHPAAFARLVLRGSYARTLSALAGRYLDYGDSSALGGLVYDPSTGQLLQRFGGPYSSLDPHLRRPYTDTFHLAAAIALPHRSAFTLDLLRSDLKHRIAAVNTGVTPADFTPVGVLDPGPDFIPGTFDDQTLVVYAQQPASLGHDQYLLTNPPGLRELTEALTASLSTLRSYAGVSASFTAEKSFGPTNPGNSPWVNEPGVAGALYSDPNSLINSTGHAFVDRAFLGKFQAWLAPAWLHGVHFYNTVNYLDGLPFARQLLVTGLPQGPFLIDTTLRGSPEGGNRAQYVLNWNLRGARTTTLPFGSLELAADVLNVLNNRNKVAESDLSGPQFDLRPAIALLPPRTLRLSLKWHF